MVTKGAARVTQIFSPFLQEALNKYTCAATQHSLQSYSTYTLYSLCSRGQLLDSYRLFLGNSNTLPLFKDIRYGKKMQQSQLELQLPSVGRLWDLSPQDTPMNVNNMIERGKGKDTSTAKPRATLTAPRDLQQ